MKRIIEIIRKSMMAPQGASPGNAAASIDAPHVQERIRKTIIVSSAFGILAIGLIVALVSILPLYARLKKEQENNLQHACKVRTMAVEEYLSRAKDIALQITSRTQIRKKLESFNRGEIVFSELVAFSGPKLADAMKLSDEVVGISRLSHTGSPLVEVGLPPPARHPLPIPPRGSREVVIHGPCLLNTKYYFLVGAHIFGAGNEPVGTDVVLFKIDRLQHIVEDYTGLGETGETLLGQPSKDHIHLFTPTRTHKDYDIDTIPINTPVGAAIAKSIQQLTGITIAREPDGNRVILAYGPMRNANWGIAVKMNTSELYSPVNRQIILIAVVLIALILLGTLGIVLLMRPLTSALQRECSGRRCAEEEKQKLESQLLQSQKLESVGKLAGGVAHDFNNLLSAIIGYSEMALKELPENHPVKQQIQTIEEAGRKGATLVRQLLAFSRKQVLRMSVVDVNDIIRNLAKMLTVMIGEDVSLVLKTAPSVKRVMADPGQIEQILMNLAVNSRDAMPGGGQLIIETAEVNLDKDYAERHEGVKPGQYLLLAVTDTGEGIERAVQEKIFDPFFTTKELGKGTGLGLATVYGIVKQHNGHIWFCSEPGGGTTFNIYLPVVYGEAIKAGEEETTGTTRGTETILVVDDNAGIRKLVAHMLEPLGYRILEASGGRDALQLSDSFAHPIQLLLTDVILEGMNGKELAVEFGVRRPDTQVIFMSGYTDNVIASRGVLERGVVFVEKPLTQNVLVSAIRKIMDARR
ncbi:MAG TPA: hypothetical protein DCO77_04550 [Nitrospiraceae bacterium]|nr:hypothetical protein [Nitrospiraceae bacterium]